MKIVRIEHSSVLRMDRPAGPYAGNTFFGPEEHDELDGDSYWSCEDEENCIHGWSERISWDSGSRRPTPASDGLGWDVGERLFGFQSDEQMRDWFTGELRRLDRFGFVAAIYRVADVQHGYRQSMFEWETAERLGDFSPLDRKGIRQALDG